MNETIRRMLQPYKTGTAADAERAVREILQEIALLGLWRGKFFEHAAFYGGTALRILYGLDRFSEDLAFTLLDSKHKFDWRIFEKSVHEELESYGFTVSFAEKVKQFDSAVKSAFLKTNTRHGMLQIGIKEKMFPEIHPEATIRIKVEIDTDPVLGFEFESLFLREPFTTPIRAVKESSLFAGKVHAALYRAWKQRIKGRDWYDVVWFLRRNVPLNARYLEACMRQNSELAKDETLTVEKVKTLLKNRLEKIDLSAAKEDVKPFLRDLSQLDLWSPDFFHHWFTFLRFE